MKLFAKYGAALTGLLISFSCLAANPPCWKLETEGAAPGDVCWFSDDLPSGAVYFIGEVVLQEKKPRCFYEGVKEDRYIKQFGGFNATWPSLREGPFTSGQSVKTFVSSYPWCSESKEAKARPLPKVNASEISEETVSLDTVVEDEAEYLSVGLLSSVNGKTKRLGKFYKGAAATGGSEEQLEIFVYAGCAWPHGAGDHNGRAGWADECFSQKSCSVDMNGNWVGSKSDLDYGNCDGNKNAGFIKIKVLAHELPEYLRKFYKQRQ